MRDGGGMAQLRSFAQDVDALNTNLATLLTVIEIITSVVTLMETDAGLRVDRWDVDYFKIALDIISYNSHLYDYKIICYVKNNSTLNCIKQHLAVVWQLWIHRHV